MARLVELALVVPIEVSSRLIEAVPAVVDRAPDAYERVRREVVLARFLGKMAVDQGLRELRSRLTPDEQPVRVEPSGSDVEPSGSDVESGEQEAVAGEVADVDDETADADAVDDVPEAATLALADYDHLSSAQIVSKLEGLDDSERAAIERYELARRHRRTILGKLELLRSADTPS